jgi:hydrogenase assembly chaperone HypC/HupF
LYILLVYDRGRRSRAKTGVYTVCLTVPAKVLKVERKRALVTSRGWTREVDTAHVKARIGDFLLVQGGIAIMTIDRKEAEEILSAWSEIEAAGDA